MSRQSKVDCGTARAVLLSVPTETVRYHAARADRYAAKHLSYPPLSLRFCSILVVCFVYAAFIFLLCTFIGVAHFEIWRI